MKKRTFLATILAVLLMSTTVWGAPAPAVYPTAIDYKIMVDSKYSAQPDEWTNATMYILSDQNGYRVNIEASASRNPYYNEFDGYVAEIYSNQSYGLIFHCVPYAEHYFTKDIYIAWYNEEEAFDHPIVVVDDEYVDYLLAGTYSFECITAQ